jgi:UDP-GlcNAc:undecaprenyl-phosphate/decaprenyl-phosphate GlcNAc-1-phosphate transferase
MNWGWLAAENHRGRRVPRMLGVPLLLTAIAGTLLTALAVSNTGRPAWTVLGAGALVFAAGLVDDLVGDGPRGIRGHARALASVRVTSGIVKVIVIVGASVIVVAAFPGHPFTVAIAGVVGIAACANLWNGLDVAPGRALKAFLLAGVPIALAGFADPGGWSLAPAVPAALFAGALLLGPDLRERGMLGDAGANLLGFVVGVGLYVVLPGPGVVIAAVAAVALNALAETLTLSRLIERTPPIRWLDRLGRISPP